MPTARDYLIQAIEEHRRELLIRICNRLQKFSHSHYETISYEQHQEREALFLKVLLHHLRHEQDPATLSTYLHQLVIQRSNEGYSLHEIEQAFDIIEDTLWEVLVKYCPLEQSLIEVLSLVRKIFHEIKNSFAQLFLQDALKTQRQFDEIRRKFAAYRNEQATDQDGENS
ncbi:hypothetical protein GF339_08785 [candidate division KSB3 bacterium]|uniref:RsbT co-antagonist protein RsbRD N-terminal domain-containing protein n=1 Tax=candidate division KSB3 bacterium TaxID=2044937 RepID=A0A9D5JVG3_9BACT|nr:hypothetical protein [candidate division KSB3 bacterium]MBD3324666.1 hypothetical protein [candidate division KSB3 bacterium]